MKKLKSALKKNPLAYACYNIYKKQSVIFETIKLRMACKYIKKDSLPTIEEAYRVLDSLRPGPKQDFYGSNVNIDENTDLTIIIPVYNAELFLEKCLNSVVEQKSDYKISVICVNDGSNDSSAAILNKFADNDSFEIIHQNNMGHSGARNTALEKKIGKYLMFIDSDDYLGGNYIKKMLDTAFKNDADIVQSGFKKCNARSVELDTIECKNGVIGSYDELERFGGAPWGRIYKSSLWDGIRYPVGMMFEDTIIFNLIFRRAKKVVGVSDTYYMYRVYGNNTLDKLQGDKRLLDAVWSVKYVYEMAKRLGMERDEKYYVFFLEQCSKHVYYRIRHFDNKVQKACFVILCNMVNDFNADRRTIGKERGFVLRELENSFNERNFSKWIICSNILKKTSG